MDSKTRLAEFNIQAVKGYILSVCFHLGEFELSNGEKSDYYIDCNPLYGNVTIRNDLAKSLHAMATLTLKNVKKISYPIGYVGMATGGIVLASIAAMQGDTQFGYLRKEQKDHGMKRVLEYPDLICNCILFDDVITTGNTIKKALDNVRNINVYAIICIANRNNLATINNVPIYSMLSESEINKMKAHEMKYSKTYKTFT